MPECPFTGRPIDDDCHIRIEFGYGSQKDMETYILPPCDEIVGILILRRLELEYQVDIEKYRVDIMDEINEATERLMQDEDK